MLRVRSPICRGWWLLSGVVLPAADGKILFP
jgi:hypothetical protein